MKRLALLLALLAASGCATTSAPTANPYGLNVIGQAEYRRIVAREPQKRLDELTKVIPGLVLDVRYATTNNFMHKVLYPSVHAFLRHPAAESLRDVEAELKSKNLGLKVFDGYRPYRVTVMMWEPIRNPDFVADPAKGSRHNRGAAVDLTLIDLATGNELLMPTPYDDFTVKARQDYNDLPPEAIANRALLTEVMQRHGFEPLPSEWWHFDYHDWQSFELMDLSFEEVAPPSS